MVFSISFYLIIFLTANLPLFAGTFDHRLSCGGNSLLSSQAKRMILTYTSRKCIAMSINVCHVHETLLSGHMQLCYANMSRDTLSLSSSIRARGFIIRCIGMVRFACSININMFSAAKEYAILQHTLDGLNKPNMSSVSLKAVTICTG